MATEVKIVASPELGEVQPESLTLFGQSVGRDWTKVNYTSAQLEKVRGNRFFAIKGEKKDALDHDQNGKKGGSADPTPPATGYAAKTVPELRELAEARGVDLGDATLKADIIAALELDDEKA